MERLFLYQDYIWASHGISCHPNKSIKKERALAVLRILTHVYLIQHVTGAIANVISTGDLRNLFPTLKIGGSYFMYIVIASKLTDAVEEITNFGDNFLNFETKRRLIRIEFHSLVCYIIWFMINVFYGIANQTVFVLDPNNQTANFDRINYWTVPPKDSFILTTIYNSFFSLLLVHFMDSLLIAAVFVYCYLAFVIYTTKGSFLDCVLKKKTLIKECRIVWSEIIAVEDTLERSLNTIPLIAMATLFQNAVSTVVVFCDADSRRASEHSNFRAIKLAIYWAFEIGIAIPILFMPFLVSWIENELKNRFKSLQRKAIREKELDTELPLLIEEIKSNLEMNLTGYRMFKLNQELVLAFFSSVISFSVLFMQLTNS